jgi:hypothetical protein
MLFDFGVGEDVGADGTNLVHCWIEVVGFVGGPGGAHLRGESAGGDDATIAARRLRSQ